MNLQGENIHENWPSDYMDEEHDLPHGHEDHILEYYEDVIPFIDNATSSTIMYNATDDDSFGTILLDPFEVYEMNNDGIKSCFHGPKMIPEKETLETICTINTIGAICSR